MRSFISNGIIPPVVFKAIGYSRRVQLWNRQASIITLPSARMSTEQGLKALERYTEESSESDRQTATKLGVNRMTLTAWLAR